MQSLQTKETPLQAIDVAHNGHTHRNGARLWRALVDAFESRTIAQVFIKDRELQTLKQDKMSLHDFYLQWKIKLREWIAAGGRPSNINLLTYLMGSVNSAEYQAILREAQGTNMSDDNNIQIDSIVKEALQKLAIEDKAGALARNRGRAVLAMAGRESRNQEECMPCTNPKCENPTTHITKNCWCPGGEKYDAEKWTAFLRRRAQRNKRKTSPGDGRTRRKPRRVGLVKDKDTPETDDKNEDESDDPFAPVRVLATVEHDDDSSILDTGAPKSLTPYLADLSNPEPLDKSIYGIGGAALKATHIGSRTIKCRTVTGKSRSITINGVYCVPEMEMGRILSVSELCSQLNAKLEIDKLGGTIKIGDDIIRIKQQVYLILQHDNDPGHGAIIEHSIAELHHKLGHAGNAKMAPICRKLGITLPPNQIECTSCAVTKSKKQPVRRKYDETKYPLGNTWAVDPVVGGKKSIGGITFGLWFVEYLSRQPKLFGMQTKSETELVQVLDEWYHEILRDQEVQHRNVTANAAVDFVGKQPPNDLMEMPKHLRCDGEHIFTTSERVARWLEDHNIKLRPAAPDSQWQHRGERHYGTLKGMSMAQLDAAQLRTEFWFGSSVCATYAKSMLALSPSVRQSAGIIPLEMWRHEPLSSKELHSLHIFGCLAFAHIPRTKRLTYGDKARAGIFVGYDQSDPLTYLIYMPMTHKITRSRDVRFFERLDASGRLLHPASSVFPNVAKNSIVPIQQTSTPAEHDALDDIVKQMGHGAFTIDPARRPQTRSQSHASLNANAVVPLAHDAETIRNDGDDESANESDADNDAPSLASNESDSDDDDAPSLASSESDSDDDDDDASSDEDTDDDAPNATDSQSRDIAEDPHADYVWVPTSRNPARAVNHHLSDLLVQAMETDNSIPPPARRIGGRRYKRLRSMWQRIKNTFHPTLPIWLQSAPIKRFLIGFLQRIRILHRGRLPLPAPSSPRVHQRRVHEPKIRILAGRNNGDDVCFDCGQEHCTCPSNASVAAVAKEPLHVVIDGLIGAGKTTTAKAIQSILQSRGHTCELMLEPVDRWMSLGLLQDQYLKNTSSSAALFQILGPMVDAISSTRTMQNSKCSIILQERCYRASKAFCQASLDPAYQLTRLTQAHYDGIIALYKAVSPLLPHGPSIRIMLKQTPEECVRRIRKRSRASEEGISHTSLQILSRFTELMWTNRAKQGEHQHTIEGANLSSEDVAQRAAEFIEDEIIRRRNLPRTDSNLPSSEMHRLAAVSENEYAEHTSNTSTADREPKTVREALASSDATAWHEAMAKEINSLLDIKGTWKYVPREPGMHVIQCKWVFKIKRLPDGSVDKFKARLVARGDKQVYGLDFDETYAPVVMYTTIRTFLSLAATNAWIVKQVDVDNAYANADVKEDVFIEQPEGFEKPEARDLVCKLAKSLYGLKQAGRNWHFMLLEALIEYGFTQSEVDVCMFWKGVDASRLTLVIYVDDVVYASASTEELVNFEKFFVKKFKCSAPKEISWLLGMEINNTTSGIQIGQPLYVKQLLESRGMVESRHAPNPIATGTELTRDANATDASRIHEAQKIVGSLLYLSMSTRPDMANAVCQLSHLMSAPPEHFDIILRHVFRYLNGTDGAKLTYKRDGDNVLFGCVDASWGDHKDSRRSTTGYVFFLNGSPISWTSKLQRQVALSS
ncbi:reverse transcriptase [Pseudoscourfieldia marina]